jgi:hypothetical protein
VISADPFPGPAAFASQDDFYGKHNPKWPDTNHFAVCSNFEQSLLKLMTSQKRWSTNVVSGWPQGKVWWSKSREEQPWRA